MDIWTPAFGLSQAVPDGVQLLRSIGVGMTLRLARSPAFIAAAIALAGCNSHRFHAEAMQYHALAQKTLIAKGICMSEQDCDAKSLLFAEGGAFSLGSASWGGAYVTLYATSDELLVQELAAKFSSLHALLKEPAVTLTVYSSKHGESKVKFKELVIR